LTAFSVTGLNTFFNRKSNFFQIKYRTEKASSIEVPAQIIRFLQTRIRESFIQAKPFEKYSYEQRTKFTLKIQRFERLNKVKMIDYS